MSDDQTSPEATTFTADEVKTSNIQMWNMCIEHCRAIIEQVAADYEHVGASVTARQMRCVSLLLAPERKSP